jgi:hypothetical protein
MLSDQRAAVGGGVRRPFGNAPRDCVLPAAGLHSLQLTRPAPRANGRRTNTSPPTVGTPLHTTPYVRAQTGEEDTRDSVREALLQLLLITSDISSVMMCRHILLCSAVQTSKDRSFAQGVPGEKKGDREDVW